MYDFLSLYLYVVVDCVISEAWTITSRHGDGGSNVPRFCLTATPPSWDSILETITIQLSDQALRCGQRHLLANIAQKKMHIFAADLLVSLAIFRMRK